MKLKLVTLALLAISFVSTKAQDLKKFGSSIEKTVGPKTIKVPYTDVITYCGYAAPGNEDETKDGKKFYYIYVWVPAVAPELGVRMVSPVGGNKVKKAIKSAEFEANSSSTEFFDTYITLERSTILTKKDINVETAKTATWTVLSSNDDSGEMPKQPSGSS